MKKQLLTSFNSFKETLVPESKLNRRKSLAFINMFRRFGFTMALALCFCTGLKAQPKPEAKQPEKPVYSPDLNSKHDVTLNGITAQQLNDWVLYSANGIDWVKDNASYNNAIRIQQNYVFVSTQLKVQLDSLLAKDKAKWQADTAKKSTKKQ